MTTRVGILASGGGTTAEAFIHATQNGTCDAEVAVVVTNNREAGVVGRVHRLNEMYGLDIQDLWINGLTHEEGRGKDGEQTLSESKAINDIFVHQNVELVLLLGYMKKVRGDLLDNYGSLESHESIFEASMLNTHPGPLPETQGLAGIDVQKKVLELGLTYSAQTLHVVSAEYDKGGVYAEHRVPVMPSDDAESLMDAVTAAEKLWIPVDVNRFIQEKSAQ